MPGDFGTEEDEIVGKTDFDFFPRKLAENYRNDDERILRTGTSEEIEELYVINGKKRTVFTVKTPLRDEQGRVSRILGIFWDITERKRVEEELHLARFSLENASVATFWIDSKGLIQYVNKRACEILGYGRQELLAMQLWDIDPEFTPDRYAQYWHDMSDGKPLQFESTNRRKDGSVFPVEISVRQGEFKGTRLNFVFFNDISDRIKIENQLLQAQKMESVGRLAGELHTISITCWASFLAIRK